MGSGPRDQLDLELPYYPRGPARHEEAGLGAHRQHRLRAWPGRLDRKGGLCLIKGGNSTAAIAQIKVAPTVKDLQDLRKMLAAGKLLQSQPNVDAATTDMI